MAAVRNLGMGSKLEAGTNHIRRGSIGVRGIGAKLFVYNIGGDGDNGNGGNED